MAIDIEKAVLAFQKAAPPDIEYGVSDEDAARGLIAAFTAVGIDLEDGVYDAWVSQRKAADEAAYEAESARRASLSPEQRAEEARVLGLLNGAMAEAFKAAVDDTTFASYALFQQGQR